MCICYYVVLRSYYVVLVLGSTSTSTTTVAASTVGDHTMGVVGGGDVAGKNWVYFAFCPKLLFQARC